MNPDRKIEFHLKHNFQNKKMVIHASVWQRDERHRGAEVGKQSGATVGGGEGCRCGREPSSRNEGNSCLWQVPMTGGGWPGGDWACQGPTLRCSKPSVLNWGLSAHRCILGLPWALQPSRGPMGLPWDSSQGNPVVKGRCSGGGHPERDTCSLTIFNPVGPAAFQEVPAHCGQAVREDSRFKA